MNIIISVIIKTVVLFSLLLLYCFLRGQNAENNSKPNIIVKLLSLHTNIQALKCITILVGASKFSPI